MKLLSKTNLYFLGASMIVFCLGGILFYFLFQRIINKDVSDKLQERKDYVIKQMANSDSLLLYQKFSANTVNVRKDHCTGAGQIISDTLIYDPVESKTVGYKQLSFCATIGNRDYRVDIRRALVEQKDVIEGVIILEGILFLAFVAILTLLNNQLSKTIWRPFYAILDKINTYKLDRVEDLQFTRDSITEFNELAASIERMSAKINQEFSIQKEFIENASHEIQTPLAIIKNKMEILLQSPGLSEKQMDSISSASLAANRLSKLNEALLILARIENNQFHQTEELCINDILDHILLNFEELLEMKGIQIDRNMSGKIISRMNPHLATILLENLVTNAIKHNIPSGLISISVDKQELKVANTGDQPRNDPSRYFQRFVKSNQKSSSLGLGLPIVKAICQTYSIPVEYTFDGGHHVIRLSFPPLESLQN